MALFLFLSRAVSRESGRISPSRCKSRVQRHIVIYDRCGHQGASRIGFVTLLYPRMVIAADSGFLPGAR